MSEDRAMLLDTAQRVFGDLEKAGIPQSWTAIESAGLANVLVDAERGGFGGGWEDAQAIFFAAGEKAVTFPIAESIVAAKLLSDAKLAVPDGSLTLAQHCEGSAAARGKTITFSGTLRGVAYGGGIDHVVALIDSDDGLRIACFPREQSKNIAPRENPAGEARDDLTFENIAVPSAPAGAWNKDRLYRAMALARAGQMAGAMAAALAISVQYTRERQQFGKPLASFQAIQQQLAVLVEEAAASRMASRAAARAADRGEAAFEIACAKLRANMAAGQAASIAHQVHGAIGFTKEYALQKFTRRLWAWRSEYGNDRRWASETGALAASRGADGFWPALVSGFAA